MKNIFLLSLIVAFSTSAFAQMDLGQNQQTPVASQEYDSNCGSCTCPQPTIIHEGWYRVYDGYLKYFDQYIKPIQNCGTLTGLQVWFKSEETAAHRFECHNNVCTEVVSTGECMVMSIRSSSSYSFTDGHSPYGVFSWYK